MDKQAFESIMKNVAEAAIKSGRKPEDITVIAATKMQSVDTLKNFSEHHLIFGENRVQELMEKYPYLPGIEWHLIGQLQTNKVKYIIDKVSLIHSVDRIELAEEIEKQASKHSKIQDVLLEINLGGEEKKGGFPPEMLDETIKSISEYKHIKICGLMTVMPLIEVKFNPYQKMNDLFCYAKQKYSKLDIKYLSMGMSNDYIMAIENGSNMVRIGRAFFGERPKA